MGVVTLRNFGRRLLARLPVPHRVIELYDRFEAGVFSIDRRRVPVIGILTILIWSSEAARLYLVDRPGSAQSVILAGLAAPPRANPEEVAQAAANRILGGSFVSRINLNLREDKNWN